VSDRFFAEALYENGFHDLVSVIPPGAQLVPSSKISQTQLGKIPGRKQGNGLWAGYNWRKHDATIDEVRQWSIDSANIGLRADRFPGVDIDTADPILAQLIEEQALMTLGPAPVRIGRAPKRLLMYRTDEPFTRMRLWVEKPDGTKHLVEILGQGQQYLVYGTHPTTMRAYSWNEDMTDALAGSLTTITAAQAKQFLDELEASLNMLALGTITREGDGRPESRVAASDQAGLRAPSLDALREVVALIPNTSELFPTRRDYLKMGYAIRAAAGPEHDDEGFEIYADWASRWDEGTNDPDTVREDWRRMTGDKAVGWSWLAEQARGFGYNDAALDFDVLGDAPDVVIEAPRYSDQWLARRVAERLKGVLRFVPETGKYLVWSTGTWHADADLLAEALIANELRTIADHVLREGVTPKEQRESTELAVKICSASKANAVAQFLRADRSIATSVSALDHDPWVLNTPGGLVDLKTGKLGPSDPDALCTKATSVPPDFAGSAPEWRRFLAETTGGDVELEQYLQRLCGYALTGSTKEQHLTFIYGAGGNGKGTFLNTVTDILGDYARTADMNTFTASRNEKHSTDIAMLAGARLVSASETEAGKRWDESKVKLLTGGDKVTARFMRQDNFFFYPQFKLVFIGNHRPEIRTVDRAMKRRIQMVPFTIEPARVDGDLGVKLREEAPAILAWMIEGALMWQRDGLNPPAIVRASTAEYFKDEDAIGRWLGERVDTAAEGRETMQELYDSYRQWANENGEYAMSLKRLSIALAQRKLEKWQHPESRRAGYKGIRIKDRQELGIL
jgi:P4 family phage/plasmid primase-like protien